MTQVAEPIPTAVTAEPAILRASGIKRSFKMGDSVVTVLKNVDLSLRTGEFIAIEGRSGSGKSTLLHILGALDAVDGGTQEFQGREYTRFTISSERGFFGMMRSTTMRAIRWLLVVATLAAGITWLFKREDWL